MMTAPTQREMQAMIDLAQATERAQIARLGRPLHGVERWWLVRAAFRFQFGSTVGDVEANRRAELVMQIIDEVLGYAPT